MKKLYYLLFILIVASGCSRDGAPGPQGVPGIQGPQGQDGLNGSAYHFEYDFNFNPENDYYEEIEYPQDFQIYPDDMVLVYLLWDNTEELGDIWRLMPQSILMDDGLLQYNYDFTQSFLSIFLDADFLLEYLGPIYTQGWVRIVIIPTQEISNGKQLETIDYSDYNAVKEAYNLPDISLPEGYKVPKRF